MKKYLLFLLIIPFVISTSCTDSDEPEAKVEPCGKTILMYMPWSSNLTSYFYQNIRDMESCIEELGGLSDQRVLVFISKTATDASLFEIEYENGTCRRSEIKNYTNPAFTTREGIAGILGDAISYAPAERYSMIIGCHGMGWLPVNASRTSRAAEKFHWDYAGATTPLTRFFGGTTSQYQTDISTLADAISDAGVKMEYILFDDCYMSTIEVAYELKDVTDYLIASTCEVMAYGMPYETMGKYLLGTPDYKAVCDEFYEFYSNYTEMPCGTLSVTDMSEIDAMAALMRDINATYTFDDTQRAKLQNLDGYNPTIFYDYGDYVRSLLSQNHASESLIEEFNAQLDRLVPHKTHTERFYTATRGPLRLDRYSGITTSDPSVSQRASDKTDTKWYHATH